MRIVQINTSDILGGAARAAYRLHKGFIKSGVSARMLVLNKASSDDNIYRVTSDGVADNLILSLIQEYYINGNRTDISNTIFTLPYPGYDLSGIKMIKDADIINLHWIAYFQSPATLKELYSLGKPVVWTLHDQWAFTGGCHYSAGCDKYKTSCSNCPQLNNDPYDIAKATFSDKLELFTDASFTIVTPSRWLADCARESKLFSNFRIETIANSLETDVFVPIPKAEAKEKVGIAPDSEAILFGAENGNEKRKGFSELLRAIKSCSENPEFHRLAKKNKLTILCLGTPSDELNSLGVPVASLGYIRSDEKIRDVYSAADIFVLPSLEDNLPNTMLESMSCATPVVAFNIGGIPEAVVDGKTGHLVPSCDIRKMSEAILDLIFNVEKRESMGKKCRRIIEEGYSIDVQAKRYLELFQELMNNYKKATSYFVPKDSNIVWDSGEPSDMIAVNLENDVGPNLEQIHEQCMLQSVKALKAERDALESAKNALKAERDALKAERDTLLNSYSWKVTKPLRVVFERISKKIPQS